MCHFHQVFEACMMHIPKKLFRDHLYQQEIKFHVNQPSIFRGYVSFQRGGYLKRETSTKITEERNDTAKGVVGGLCACVCECVNN